MRRFFAVAVFAGLISAFPVSPASAQAPTPKVTLSGLFDQVTSMGRNFYDSNFARNSDSEWYARTRFRPDFEFAVGRVKAVLGIEIDLQYGRAARGVRVFPRAVARSTQTAVSTSTPTSAACSRSSGSTPNFP